MGVTASIKVAIQNNDTTVAHITSHMKRDWKEAVDLTTNFATRVIVTRRTIEFANGSTVRFFSTDAPEKIRGHRFDSVIFDEMVPVDHALNSIIHSALKALKNDTK